MNFKNHKSIFEYIISHLMILEKICKHNGADHSQYFNPIRPGGGEGSEAQMTKLTADNQKPLTL